MRQRPGRRPPRISFLSGAVSLCGREQVHGPRPTLCPELPAGRGQGDDKQRGTGQAGWARAESWPRIGAGGGFLLTALRRVGRHASQADGGGPSPASALGSPRRDFPASAGPGSRGLSSWNKERSLGHGVGLQNRFWLAFLPMLSSLSFSSKMSVHFLILPSGKRQPGRLYPGALGYQRGLSAEPAAGPRAPPGL